MKALSLKQPWLYAITCMDKRIENRTWKPPQQVIGQRIALHASKKDDPLGYSAIAKIAGIEIDGDLPRGAIVGTVRVVGWLNDDGLGDVPTPCLGHLVDDDWFFGPIGWILDDVQLLDEPIPARGSLGLWDVPEELLPKLRAS